MNDEINYKNNPLHGLSLKKLLVEIVDHYDFEILFAYLNINCFKTNPSIESSVKFLKKTTWAREKVEAFYLYTFKSLPKASDEQFQLPPRDRIIPEDQKPKEPAALNLEDAQRLREKREKKANAYPSTENRHTRPKRNDSNNNRKKSNNRKSIHTENTRSDASSKTSSINPSDPWANAKIKNLERKK